MWNMQEPRAPEVRRESQGLLEPTLEIKLASAASALPSLPALLRGSLLSPQPAWLSPKLLGSSKPNPTSLLQVSQLQAWRPHTPLS